MAIEQDTIFITEKNLQRIKSLMHSGMEEQYENLELELDRAKVIPEDSIPADLVTMNSKVKFYIPQDDKTMTITVVYPADANSEEGKVSVLAPLGSALIGLRVGQKINWTFPAGKTKTIEIQEVLYQPESQGEGH